jgi:hypothetical protein
MRAVVIIALVTAATRAEARDWDSLANQIQAGAWAHYEVSDVHAIDDGTMPRTLTDLTLVGFRLHGFVSRHRLGWHVGIDGAAGATEGRAGFAYDVAFLPIGVGFRWGDTQMIGVGTGIGAMGAVGTLDDAVTFPIEAFAELALGSHVRILARARMSYLSGAGGRARGSPTIGFADEVDGMLGLRIGHVYREYLPAGNGYFAGVAYREMLGAKFAGLVIGYSIDLAYPDHHR